jgi:hypothetical protein
MFFSAAFVRAGRGRRANTTARDLCVSVEQACGVDPGDVQCEWHRHRVGSEKTETSHHTERHSRVRCHYPTLCSILAFVFILYPCTVICTVICSTVYWGMLGSREAGAPMKAMDTYGIVLYLSLICPFTSLESNGGPAYLGY